VPLGLPGGKPLPLCLIAACCRLLIRVEGAQIS
jgi:hypothetical protein